MAPLKIFWTDFQAGEIKTDLNVDWGLFLLRSKMTQTLSNSIYKHLTFFSSVLVSRKQARMLHKTVTSQWEEILP